MKHFNTIPYTQKQLYKVYSITINAITDECDWVTSFSGEEICNIIHRIVNKKLESRKESLPFTSTKLHILYSNEIKKLNLNEDEWREQYAKNTEGPKKICTIIHNIIKTNLEKRKVVTEKTKK